MRSHKLYNLVLGALFAALIFVATAVISIPIPGGAGYVHLGDVLVYLTGVILPLPFSVISAAVGGALADLQAGVPIYLPATILIKGLTSFAFTGKNEKMLCPRNFIALPVAMLLCAGGYFVYECFIYDVSTAVAGIVYNLIQALASIVLFVILGLIFDKVGLVGRLRARH